MAEPALTYSPLSVSECNWIAHQLARAPELFADLIQAPVSASPDLACLDAAFAAWLESLEAGEHDAQSMNAVINVFGAAFGAILVREAGFEWTIATDEFGTELAVRARPNRGDVTVFPANFVAKRWERREAPFFVQAYGEILESVETTAAKWPALH